MKIIHQDAYAILNDNELDKIRYRFLKLTGDHSRIEEFYDNGHPEGYYQLADVADQYSKWFRELGDRKKAALPMYEDIGHGRPAKGTKKG